MSEIARELGVDDRALLAERHGAPTIVTEVACKRCGGLLVKDVADFWVHVESGLCTIATVDVVEVADES